MFPMDIKDDYFEWMYDLIEKNRHEGASSFRRLLLYLDSVEFRYRIRNDSDRANDGIALRRRYALRMEGYEYEYILDCLEGPCSVFEMMVALAIRCEETIMADPLVGDRTGHWFWRMIVNMGLGGMTDAHFDRKYVEKVVKTFLDRKYEPDGRGGLFTIKNCDKDLRKVGIWSITMWYLDTII